MSTLTETGTARAYPVGCDQVDLVKLIGTYYQLPEADQADWVRPAQAGDAQVGEVAYVHSYGDLRRGVVVKVGKTRITVAFTTEGARTQHERYMVDIKVTVKAEQLEYIRLYRPAVQAPAAPVAVEAPATVEAEQAPAVDQAGVDAYVSPVMLTAPQQRNLDVIKAHGGIARIGASWPRGLHIVALESMARKGVLRYDDKIGFWIPGYGPDAAQAPAAPVVDEAEQAPAVVEADQLVDEAPAAPAQDAQDAPADVDAPVAQGGAPTAASTGSEVIAALESLWAALRVDHPELPDVVFITGMGALGSKWGHTGHKRWAAGAIGVELDKSRKAGDDRLSEVFIAGERLACGAVLTAQTVLHEGVHVLADVRGVQDTSRQGRYHNKTFVKLGEELGLRWPEGQKPDKAIGFSAVVITEETRKRYAAQIDRLGEAIRLFIPLAGLMAMGVGAEGDAGVEGPNIPKAAPVATGRQASLAMCACEEPRRIRVAPSVLALGGIGCNICGEEFASQGDEDGDA